MKKYQDFGLHTTTDLKVFLLFLLDNIRSPIDEETLLYIVEENTEIKIHPSVFDFEVWSELSEEYKGRLHIVMSDSPIVKFKKQKGENVPQLLFEFFTRYQEILKEYI